MGETLARSAIATNAGRCQSERDQTRQWQNMRRDTRTAATCDGILCALRSAAMVPKKVREPRLAKNREAVDTTSRLRAIIDWRCGWKALTCR